MSASDGVVVSNDWDDRVCIIVEPTQILSKYCKHKILYHSAVNQLCDSDEIKSSETT